MKVALDRIKAGEREETLVNHTIYYIVCKPKDKTQDSLAKLCFDDRAYERSQSKSNIMQNSTMSQDRWRSMKSTTRENWCSPCGVSLSISKTSPLTSSWRSWVLVTNRARNSRGRWRTTVRREKQCCRAASLKTPLKNQSDFLSYWVRSCAVADRAWPRPTRES